MVVGFGARWLRRSNMVENGAVGLLTELLAQNLVILAPRPQKILGALIGNHCLQV
jgi:hypothetical protein